VAHPVCYWMRTWILLGVTRLGFAGDYSPPSTTSACHEWHGQVQLYLYTFRRQWRQLALPIFFMSWSPRGWSCVSQLTASV